MMLRKINWQQAGQFQAPYVSMAPEVDLSLLRAAFKEDTAVSVEVKKAAFSVRVGLSTHLWLVFPYRTHLTPIWINNTAFSLKNRCQTGSRTV